MSDRTLLFRWAAGGDEEFRRELGEQVARALAERVAIEELKVGDGAPDSLNPGRSRVDFITVQGRPLVLRHYCRGGMVRHLLRDSFLRVPLPFFQGGRIFQGGRYRPFDELGILERLSAHGVAVPTPVVGAVRHIFGGWAYRAVIVTEELPEVQNLLFLALTAKLQSEEQTRVAELCKKAGAEAAKMVAQQVVHPDLHLGNVLVQHHEQVVLIDFDRAECAPQLSEERLQQSLIARWNRSLLKHGVSEFTLGAFEAGLRGS